LPTIRKLLPSDGVLLRMRPSVVLSSLVLVAFGGSAVAAPLAAHHAVYKLTLDTTKEEGVMAASGTMSYDVLDTCSGWTTSQHLVIELTNKDGQDVRMVSDYATLESKDGTHLDFHTKEMTGQTTTQQLDGTAVLDKSGGKGHADFTAPEKNTVLLPIGTLLPMAHTSAIIDAAMAGKKFVSVPLFDGTGPNGAEDTFVTIESWKPAAEQKFSALSGLPFGRVHVAFFDRTNDSETPTYEIGMKYFSNGVADTMVMNFGEFSMDGVLDQFELRPATRCQG
jgi:hypothetical protein